MSSFALLKLQETKLYDALKPYHQRLEGESFYTIPVPTVDGDYSLSRQLVLQSRLFRPDAIESFKLGKNLLDDEPSDVETCISRSTYEPPSPDYCPSPSFNWPNSPPSYCPSSPVYCPSSPVNWPSPPDYAPILDNNESPYTSFPYDEPVKSYYRQDDGLFGKVGLHCYNLQNRTNLEYFCLDDKEYPPLVKFYARDPTREFSIYEFSICEFFTRVVESAKDGYSLSFITTQCTLLPEKEGFPICDHFDKLAVDAFFTGDMPNSLPEVTTTSDNLQFYELKESELEEEKEWLLLYLELSLRTNSFPFSSLGESSFDLKKVIVLTRADVFSKKKTKSENAIFYITFTSCGPQDGIPIIRNAIIRRTMDGIPGHMSLEVKSLV
ncbi:PREDICTED: UPF0725 protein At4g29550-like [Camelina sativa]|uniref:UPF0725 protein At4g29550-like n=1 Tax=Camelina sativa TaxID=90675 RepID=A0ABM0ZAT1_CAMSA|nr:PREDICTED: UPF0725 protein At4g29550-like [Camelina sativa]